MSLKIIRLFWGLFWGFTVLSFSAHAYFLPSFYVVKSWVKRHHEAKPLRFSFRVAADEKFTGVRFKETVYYYPSTHMLISWASDDADKKLYFTEKKINSTSLLTKVLWGAPTDILVSGLKEKRIPVKTEADLMEFKTESERRKSEIQSFERWNDSVALVIGKVEKNSKPVPQIWFEQDTFLPLRLIYPTEGEDGDLREFRFRGFQYSQGFPFPRIVTMSNLSAETLLVAQLEDVSTQVSHTSGHEGFTAYGENAPSDLKRLIQYYYVYFR